MKQKKAPNLKRAAAALGFVLLFLGLTGESCTPDRIVDVVVTVDITASFHAQGTLNNFSGMTTVSVEDQIDIDQILEDNDLESIDTLTVQSAFLMTTVKDPTASRTVSGSIDVQELGAPATLVEFQSAAVNDPIWEDWNPVALQSGGVAVLNGALARVVAGLPATLTFTVGGTSAPTDVDTDFWWDAKLRLNVVGTRKITVFEPI
jgi:hypothetical protein